MPFQLDVCTAQFYFCAGKLLRQEALWISQSWFTQLLRWWVWQLAGCLPVINMRSKKAEQLAEREEMVAELSAAKQQITQSEHWRAECELLNNEVRSLQSINTSLEADLREVTTRMEAAQQHADDKIRQMINSEQRLSEQFENLANRIF